MGQPNMNLGIKGSCYVPDFKDPLTWWSFFLFFCFLFWSLHVKALPYYQEYFNEEGISTWFGEAHQEKAS